MGQFHHGKHHQHRTGHAADDRGRGLTAGETHQEQVRHTGTQGQGHHNNTGLIAHADNFVPTHQQVKEYRTHTQRTTTGNRVTMNTENDQDNKRSDMNAHSQPAHTCTLTAPKKHTRNLGKTDRHNDGQTLTGTMEEYRNRIRGERTTDWQITNGTQPQSNLRAGETAAAARGD
jgi:hypothetical protein